MRKFLLSLLVMLTAGMGYALAATLPTTSTPNKPALYYIRNTRADKFAVLNNTAENMGLTSDKSQASMFWFEAAGELINDTYLPVKIHNITTAMAMGSFNVWGGQGNTWYIRENTVNSEFLGIGAAAGDEGNTSLWWNDYAGAGTTIGSWCLNGDSGSIWDIVAVPEDEVPAGITVITWNLKKGDKVISTVKSAAVQGVTYPVPFSNLACDGGSATGGAKDQTVDVAYKENIPFVSSESASNATWYKAIMRGNKYLHYDNPEVSCNTGNSSKNDMGSYFAFVGDVINGFRMYNAALPAGKALGGNLGDRLTAVPEEEAPSFILENNSGHFVFRNPESPIGYLNDNNSYLAYWITSAGATDGGSTWTFEAVDEKQSEALNNTTVITSDEDFVNFAQYLANGHSNANAILLADINVNQMVNCGDYQGTFDGNGHTITLNLTQNSSDGIALFRNIGTQGVVQNLKVQGTITSSKKFASAIAAWNSGHIYGCYIDLTVESTLNGDATHGGVAGVAYRGTVIENCLVKFNINGEGTQNCGGVVGWANDPINIVNTLVLNHENNFDHNSGSNNIARNGGNLRAVNVDNYNQDIYSNRPNGACFNNYVTQQWGDNTATTVIAFEDLADGKICYQLNTDQSKVNWVQNIGTDPFPVPAAFGSGQVYASGVTSCKGTSAEALTYTNTPSNVVNTAHKFDKYGICSECGFFNFHALDRDMSDGTYLLKSAADLDIAEGWNRVGDGFKLNMKMANDIEYKAEAGKYIFNTSNWVDGSFNGDGHVLTIEMSDLGNYASFIPQHTGVFENVIMHGSIGTSGQYAGSISGEGRQSAVRNVYSDINITSTKVGDNTSGGLFGMIRTGKHIDNCIYAGTFTLPGAAAGARCARVGGVAGWTHEKTYVTNLAILGKFIGAGNQTLDNDTENSQNIARNPGNIVAKNVYVLNPIVGNSVSDHDKYTKIENPESVASGELAFLLNESKSGGENFYQLIGTDPMPMPIAKDGAKIYTKADSYTCDGKPLGNITYLNEETTPTLPAHEFEDGVCVNCENLDTDEDGYNKITSAKSLARFSALVNMGNGDMKVRMYNDVNMKGVDYATAGSQAAPFNGEFDGQNHVIKNLKVNGGDYTGLIGVITDGAIVKNFTLDKTCAINGNAFCGIIGGTNGGGNVYISNLGNEGNVTGTAQNASGILGVDMGGSMTLHISNCYVSGAIKGDRESATICSWSNDASVVENCWSIATIEGVYGNNTFTRGGTTVKNGYELEGIGTQNGDDHTKDKTNLISAEEVANGTLCFKLGDAFGQVLGVDEYPNLAAVTGFNEVRYDDQYGFGYYNPLPLAIMDNNFEAVATPDEDQTAVKSADIKGTFLLTEKADGFTDNAVAFIMDAAEYAEKGIYGKHLFGAVAKNGDFSIDADGKVAINFVSFSTNTDQPIFSGDLDRKDVGDVASDAKYIVAIYGGSLVADGVTEKATIIKSYTGADLLATVIAEALAFNNVDDATAINGVNTDNNDGAIYSITGVRVNKAQKGIYIINGKKTAVK